MKKLPVLLSLIVCHFGHSQELSHLIKPLVEDGYAYQQKPVMLELLNEHVKYDSIYVLLTIHPSGIPDSVLMTSMLYSEGEIRKVHFLKLKSSLVLIPQSDLPVDEKLYKEIFALMEEEYGKGKVPDKTGFRYLRDGFPMVGGSDF